MDHNSVISVLQKLIETSHDGEQGFQTASQHAKSSELKSLFKAGAQQCAEGARELQNIVVGYGGDADVGRSAAGSAHNMWTSVKASFASFDDLGILEEIEKGEDVATERYRDALEQPLPNDVKEVIEQQYQGVIENHDKVKILRDRLRAMQSL
jgi:uncharacterized protein (TIGR02284 family)